MDFLFLTLPVTCTISGQTLRTYASCVAISPFNDFARPYTVNNWFRVKERICHGHYDKAQTSS